MRKVVTFSSPPMPKDVLNKLISAVIQENGETNYLGWSVNEQGELELFEEES